MNVNAKNDDKFKVSVTVVENENVDVMEDVNEHF